MKDQTEMALDKVLQLQEQLGKLEEQYKESQKEIMRYQHESMSKEKQLKQQDMDMKRLQLKEEDLRDTISKGSKCCLLFLHH